MKLTHRQLTGIISRGRKTSLSQTILLLTGMMFFSTTQAATQHIVESGESISQIALRYDISQMALINANGLQVTDLEIGQLLHVPDKNDRNNLYKVESGDTLSSLALKYKVDANELARINNLSPESGLLINSILTIPATGERALPKAPPKNNNSATSDNRQNITVTSKAGNAANTKSSTTTESGRYRVKYGDSLIKVAGLYNVDVNSLAKANDMSLKDPLYFGRYITIPAAGTVTRSAAVTTTAAVKPVNMQYAVQSGDTLMGIANKFKADFRQVAKLSGIDYNDGLKVGQILTIPNKIK